MSKKPSTATKKPSTDAKAGKPATKPKLSSDNPITLEDIVVSTRTQLGYTFAMKAEVSKLIAQGLVELNENIVDPANPSRFAVRASEKALALSENTDNTTSQVEYATDTEGNTNVDNVTQSDVVENAAVVETPVDASVAPTEAAKKARAPMAKLPDELVIEDAPEAPESAGKRGGARKAFYDFDNVELGKGFFVANTEDRPDARKSLTSTVNTANRKFKDAGQTNKFILFDGKKVVDGVEVEGAWVKRTA